MSKTEKATLGGGCFWCLEAVYQDLQGVSKVESGYAGGTAADPTYEDVCEGTTGHAEVVQVTFDPNVTPYREILEVFFTIHDPTTMNRQGGDEGTQYRSVIFTHNAEQEKVARAFIKELTDDKAFDSKIVTQVEPLTDFFVAEEYHQRYYERNPYAGYCMAVVRPKLAKFRKKWTAKLKVAA